MVVVRVLLRDRRLSVHLVPRRLATSQQPRHTAPASTRIQVLPLQPFALETDHHPRQVVVCITALAMLTAP